MSAEAVSEGARALTGRIQPDPAARAVTGVLPDGTAFYAPIGEVIATGDLVLCHLCGRWLRSVTAHLRVHGYTKDAYCEVFGLERGQSLEAEATRKLRAAAFTPRLVFDPAVRLGSAAGRQRALAGELTRDAARAALGRPVPEQRRKKAASARASMRPEAVARANRARAERQLRRVASAVASQQGYPDLGAYVLARARRGVSLATISREAGLHKDWMSRHLATIAPAAAAEIRQHQLGRRLDARWQPAITRLGFSAVADYLLDRHVHQHRTMSAIAAELGVSHHAVGAALVRHGLARTSHATTRQAARQRAGEVAAQLGVSDVASYILGRRDAGWTWRAISVESGQPPSWLRRHRAEPESR